MKANEVKDDHSIVEVAERLGLTLKPSGSVYRCQCPVHGSEDDDLVVFPDTGRAFCHSGKCGFNGDMIDLVEQSQGMSFRDALEWIAGPDATEYVPKAKPVRPAAVKTPEERAAYKQWFTQKARHGLTNQEGSMSYWHSRGLSAATVNHFQLGLSIFNGREYQMATGQVLSKVRFFRYTIPWYYGEEIIGVKTRLAYDLAKETIAGINPELLDRIKLDLELRGKPNDIDNLIDALAGPRYLGYGETGKKTFNINALVDRTEGGFERKDLPVVFVVEGEIDAMTLHEYGIPAVVMKGVERVAFGLAKAWHVVVVRDNDNAGLEYQLYVMDHSLRVQGQTIFPARPNTAYKDINEMHVANPVETKRWVRELFRNLRLITPLMENHYGDNLPGVYRQYMTF